MIRFAEARPGLHSPIWKEARWLWQGDRLRKPHLEQLHALRHWVSLGQCRLWLAFDSDPPPKESLQWMQPLHVIGMVITMPLNRDTLTIQFAAGRRLQSWMPFATYRLEQLARQENYACMRVHLRAGWHKLLPRSWKASPTVELRPDPELLYVRPDAIAA